MSLVSSMKYRFMRGAVIRHKTSDSYSFSVFSRKFLQFSRHLLFNTLLTCELEVILWNIAENKRLSRFAQTRFILWIFAFTYEGYSLPTITQNGWIYFMSEKFKHAHVWKPSNESENTSAENLVVRTPSTGCRSYFPP